jgi:hypothetical protein
MRDTRSRRIDRAQVLRYPTDASPEGGSTNRAALVPRLAQANAMVADGERRIARQKMLIHKLNRDGPTGVNADEYLRVLQSI